MPTATSKSVNASRNALLSSRRQTAKSRALLEARTKNIPPPATDDDTPKLSFDEIKAKQKAAIERQRQMKAKSSKPPKNKVKSAWVDITRTNKENAFSSNNSSSMFSPDHLERAKLRDEAAVRRAQERAAKANEGVMTFSPPDHAAADEAKKAKEKRIAAR